MVLLVCHLMYRPATERLYPSIWIVPGVCPVTEMAGSVHSQRRADKTVIRCRWLLFYWPDSTRKVVWPEKDFTRCRNLAGQLGQTVSNLEARHHRTHPFLLRQLAPLP